MGVSDAALADSKPEQPEKSGLLARVQEGLAEDGYILTNNHVVQDSDDIEVAVESNGTKRSYKATVIGTDPADPIVQMPAKTPLPNVLRDDEIGRLVRTAQDYLWDRNKPDARPYLLISLLLQSGMKKAECARLLITDIDISRPQAPELRIQYAEERHAHKNRTLPLTATIVPSFQQYLDQYKPEQFLFECTPRNLEYVLDEVGQRADIKRTQVGFETLRWTCALRDYRTGMSEEQLRQKMGLSKISWRETREKIFQLANR